MTQQQSAFMAELNALPTHIQIMLVAGFCSTIWVVLCLIFPKRYFNKRSEKKYEPLNPEQVLEVHMMVSKRMRDPGQWVSDMGTSITPKGNYLDIWRDGNGLVHTVETKPDSPGAFDRHQVIVVLRIRIART